MIKYQGFMVNALLQKRFFQTDENIEHEHCAMCGAKFSADPENLHEGYVSLEGNHWVCPECYGEYKAEYGWSDMI